MSENEKSLPLPNVPFAVSELMAMTSVISGYVAYLQSLPPSPDGERRITRLASVRDRLQAQFALGNLEVQVPLDVEEVSDLLEAMLGFVEQIKRLFPKNRERDQVISTVNYWRLRLISIISEHAVE
jgi:hypothetical protein